MLNAVIRAALRYRMLVIVISLVLLVYGSYLATQMPIDVFPDLDRPRVVIITECPGLATEEVETLVTQPVEIALLGANGVDAVRSQTTAGLNVIYIEFDWTTDVRTARQTVQERLTTVQSLLPPGIQPQMTPTASIMGQIVIAGIYRQNGPRGGLLVPVEATGVALEVDAETTPPTVLGLWRVTQRREPAQWPELPAEGVAWQADSRTASLTVAGRQYEVRVPTAGQQSIELRTAADWVVRPRLLKIPGVAEVFIQGGDRKQYQVLVDPGALLEYGVTLQQVELALQESNINTSGGFAVTGETERSIRILGRLGPDSATVLSELRQVPVKVNPQRSVLLGQVAEVVEGPQFKRGDGSINGRPGVVFTIAKQPHVDTRGLTLAVEAAFSEVEAALPVDILVNSELFRLKNFIDRGIFNVGEALVIGATLVIVILFLFLMNFRTTFITLTAIPLSLVITTLVFRLIGSLTGTELSINVMTLGGIAVALGELVDDAIVDVENIFRRLKENHGLAHPRPALQVVYEASCEIRGAIVFGTIVVILVFLPLFALSGVEGRLFAPLGVAYIVSILASLAVSLTVTPVLSYYLLPQSRAAHHRGDGWLLQGLKFFASYLIRFSMARPLALLVLTWVGMAAAGWLVTGLGRNFLPPFDEGSVQINVTLPPGSSLDASTRASQLIDRRLDAIRKTAQHPRGRPAAFCSPHRPGRDGRARDAGQWQRVHPEHRSPRTPEPRGDH